MSIVGVALAAFVVGFVIADWTRRRPRIWERGVLVRDPVLSRDKAFVDGLTQLIRATYEKRG